MHNRNQDLHDTPLRPEWLKFVGTKGFGWALASDAKGYWKLSERTGLHELEVSLQGFHPPIIQVPSSSSAMPGRLLPLLQVASIAAWRFQSMHANRQFSIQLHDEDQVK